MTVRELLVMSDGAALFWLWASGCVLLWVVLGFKHKEHDINPVLFLVLIWPVILPGAAVWFVLSLPYRAGQWLREWAEKRGLVDRG